MTITFVDAQYTDATGTGTAVIPTGTQSGDVLIAIVLDNLGTPTNPGGWTQVGVNRVDVVTTVNVWYIQRTSSTPNLTWGGTGGSGTDIDIVAYRGAAGTPNITGQSALNSAVAPSVTTTVDNCMLICLYADAADQTITVPAGMVSRTDASGTSNNAYAELQLGAAGATGTKTFTGTTDTIAAWSVALAPGPAGFPPRRNTPNRIWSVW